MEKAVVGRHVAPWLHKLVQGIILQAIEDLYCDELRCDCMALFEGEDFEICAETAGMDVASQTVLLNLVRHIIAANDSRTETDTCVKSDKRFATASRKEAFSTRKQEIEATAGSGTFWVGLDY
jgi:hypothetical protein